MKTLLVVYSRTGRTRGVGEEIARECGAVMREIRDVRSRKGFFGFMRSIQDVRKARTPAIEPLSIDVSAYDLVILGAPVWAGHMAAPLRTFIEQNKGRFRRIAVFCTLGGSGAETAMAEMAQAAGPTPVARLAVKDAEIEKGTDAQKIRQFTSAVRALEIAPADAVTSREETVRAEPQRAPSFPVGGKGAGAERTAPK